MSAEYQQEIEKIFNSFDADKSGTIELNQLRAVAEALGEKIEEDQCKQIMQKLDANGDGKISLEEFKFWWQQGRKGKLGDLVYLKAKTMKMTQVFLDQFKKAGVNFNQFIKDDKIDLLSASIHFGEPNNEGLEIEINASIGGHRFKAQFEQLQQKVSWLKEDSINLVLLFPSDDPTKAKEEVMDLLSKFIDSGVVPFLSNEEDNQYLAIKLQPIEKCLVFHIQVKKKLAQLIDAPAKQFDQTKSIFDKDFYIYWRAAIKTNFSINDLIDSGDLIQSLLKGFSISFSGQTPSAVLKKFREVVEASRGYENGFTFVLSILLKSAQFRLKLRSPLMVEKFFQKVGIKDILKQCPCLEDILQQLALMPEIQEAKYQVESAKHLFYQFLKCMKNNFNSGIEAYIQRQDSLVCLRVACPNAHKIFNIVFNEA